MGMYFSVYSNINPKLFLHLLMSRIHTDRTTLTVCILTAAIQRDAQYWSNPTEFCPDRFLVPLDRAQNDAYMPFSKGPLNCIGRQLALTEAQVVMVLTLRFFDFEPMYASDAPVIPGWGGKAYQELKLGAKPKDGIPMRVRLRGDGGKKEVR